MIRDFDYSHDMMSYIFYEVHFGPISSLYLIMSAGRLSEMRYLSY